MSRFVPTFIPTALAAVITCLQRTGLIDKLAFDCDPR
jgi:hypothetical protein